MPFPLSPDELTALAETYPTPFYLYDAAGMQSVVRDLQQAFAWAPAYRQYFAVKATPNPHILRLLAEVGCGADCSSLAELALAERAGLRGAAVMFSSNNTPGEEFIAARRLDALINLDAVELLDDLEYAAGLPEFLSFRLNPGPALDGNAIIGRPEESKFGATRDQLFAGYAAARDRGVQRFGLHTMVVSNERSTAAHAATARLLFELAAELQASLGITIELINLGGGIGIPYRPDEAAADLAAIGAAVHSLYRQVFGAHGPALAHECGRLISGPHGYLISRVRHLKHTYRRYAGLDAAMHNLMRPAMYGAYHAISVPAKDHLSTRETYDVTGSLCENNDKFAIGRELPPLEAGDLVVIHDAGAHGHAMGFSYNGKLRSAELLRDSDGSIRLIRRAESLDDLFATIVE